MSFIFIKSRSRKFLVQEEIFSFDRFIRDDGDPVLVCPHPMDPSNGVPLRASQSPRPDTRLKSTNAWTSLKPSTTCTDWHSRRGRLSGSFWRICKRLLQLWRSFAVQPHSGRRKRRFTRSHVEASGISSWPGQEAGVKGVQWCSKVVRALAMSRGHRGDIERICLHLPAHHLASRNHDEARGAASAMLSRAPEETESTAQAVCGAIFAFLNSLWLCCCQPSVSTSSGEPPVHPVQPYVAIDEDSAQQEAVGEEEYLDGALPAEDAVGAEVDSNLEEISLD
eukprot:s1829_g7.t1